MQQVATHEDRLPIEEQSLIMKGVIRQVGITMDRSKSWGISGMSFITVAVGGWNNIDGYVFGLFLLMQMEILIKSKLPHRV